MRIQHKLGAAVAALGLAAAAAGTASADVSILGETSLYTFNTVDPGAGLGAGPFGTLLVEELTANKLKLTVDLNDPTYLFHSGNANHPALAFNLAGSPTITMNFLDPVGGTTDLAVDGQFAQGGAVSSPPFGIFGFSVTYDRLLPPPPNNPASNFAGPLVFTISSLSTLDVSSFLPTTTKDGTAIYFTADLAKGGSTGNVGATFTRGTVPEVPGVPEPATWMMMLVGFAGLGGALRMNRRGSRALFATA